MSKTNVISNVDKEAYKRKSKLLNVDTSCYENIIYNKKDIAIKLFNEFDKQILNISNNIKRNYLMKNVAYKLDKKIIEVQINQSDILVSFYKDIKQFDNLNRLSIRKGYENSTLCYYIKIKEEKDIDIIMPYIIKSYEISKYNSVDLKNNFIELYYLEKK